MTWAIKPQPTTPTLSLPIVTPFEFAGTFHRPYTKGFAVSTPPGSALAREDLDGLRDAFFRGHKRVFVLDRDRVDAGRFRERGGKGAPPGTIMPAAHHREVPRHLFRGTRPAAVEQPIEGKAVLGEHDILAVTVAGPLADSLDH